MDRIEIRPFQKEDQDEVRRLVLEGLKERFDRIDETLNPDLDSIEVSYLRKGHAFWVAETDGEIVGTGGFLSIDERQSRIVRMSVAKEYRRRGIGKRLIQQFIDLSKEAGKMEILVSTEAHWIEAVCLYEHFGFRQFDSDEIDLHFKRSIQTDPSRP